MCRWRQLEETFRCDGGGFTIWGRRHNLGFVICCRWLIFVCIYASVVFTFSCMKNMEVPWWWHDSQIVLTMKEKITMVADLWLWVSDVAVADRAMVESWWLPRISGGEDEMLKMQRDTYGLGSTENRDRI